MTNVRFESISNYRDVETLNIYHELVDKRGLAKQDVLAMIYAKGRDNARTPMQWDESPNAGFSTGHPWLQVNPNYDTINAKQALADPNSIFYYYQQLIRLRKSMPIIVHGSYDLLPDDSDIYAYTRILGDEKLLVILNFGKGTPTFLSLIHI